MRRSLLVLGLLLGLALLAGRTEARGTLDQSNTFGTNDGGQISRGMPLVVFGQTFTAGISGALDTVTLDLLSVNESNDTATVGIYAVTAAGLPDPAALLASTTVTVTQRTFTENPSLYTVATFSSPATVAAGQQYAIVLSNPQPAGATIDWNGQTPSEYPRGQLVDSASGTSGPYFGVRNFSLDFQTFVTPPAPAASPSPAPSIVFISPEFGLTTTGCGTTNPAPGPVFVNNLQNVIVTAIPCPGSRFTGWTNGPCNGTTINPCDISPTAGVITANFSP